MFDHEFPVYEDEADDDYLDCADDPNLITTTVFHNNGTRSDTLPYSGHDGIDFGLNYDYVLAAHAAWSSDGRQLAYVLMPDTNIPFVVGELWLADAATGAPLTLLAQVDAGHGYAPVWSPDGRSIVYVRRENPEDIRANMDPLALRSNLSQVEVDSGDITPITQFPDSLVYDAVWSPDGRSLAFTADDAVWLWQPGGLPAPVSPGGVYRHPAWLVLP